jgi:hypothetical protein
VAHRLINGNDLNTIDTYSELKTELLYGDHVEAVGYLNQCEGAEALGRDSTVGYQIQRFNVINEATPEEFIVFDDLAVLSADGSDFAIGTEQVIVFRDGSADVTIVIFDGMLQQLNNFTLKCTVGSSLRFTVHNRENENTYTTYEDIKASTLEGHDMELVVFPASCSVISGEPAAPGTIVAARFDEFQLFKAGGIWGDVEYIAYSTWSIDVEGQLFVEVARLYENGDLTVEYFVYTTAQGEFVSGMLSCPLGRGSLFHAVGRTRAPVTDYAEIIADIQERGQTFEIEIDYDTCQTGEIQYSSIYGGIAWQTYVDPTPETGFFYANEFNMVQQNFTGTPSPGWDVAGIAVFPDTTVFISSRLYDYATGASLIDTETVVCQLGNGVTFYRYP